MDVFTSILRVARGAGSLALFSLPEQLEIIIERAKQGGGIIITAGAKVVNSSLNILGSTTSSNNLETFQNISSNTSGFNMTNANTFFSFHQAHSFGGLLVYLTSKWSFATVALVYISHHISMKLLNNSSRPFF